MASVVRSLRVCLPPCRRAPAPCGLTPRVAYPRRVLSTTPIRRADDDAPNDDEATSDVGPRKDLEFIKAPPKKTQPSRMTREQLEQLGVSGVRRHTPRMSGGKWDLVDDQLDHLKETIALPNEAEKEFEEISKEVDAWHQGISKVAAAPKKSAIKKDSFWGEDEEDPDYMIPDVEDEELGEDDILSLAHGKLEEFREYREYARVAAWQMPLLSKLARKFEPPKADECLRFRYTTYMGEEHPAQSKVVVEFSPADLPLNEAQQVKLQKLLGPRLNPETNIAKISCEQFDHQAQNKRYLGDLVGKLIAQAKDSTDMFTDVPLDTRHHQFKQKKRFPVHWRLTEERVREIEEAREQALLLDQQKAEAGTLIDGAERVEHYLTIPAALPKSAPRLGSKRAR